MRRSSSWLAALLWGALVAVLSAQGSADFITVERAGRRIPVARFLNNAWVRSCAVAGEPAARVMPLPADGPERADLIGPIRQLFDERQREQRLSAVDLAKVPITVDWVFRYAPPGEAPVYYFEASKWKPDPDGALRVTVSGWLQRRRNGGIAPMASKGELRWEEIGAVDAVRAPDLLPLGVARSGGQEIWIMESRAGTRPSILLYDVKPGEAQLLLRAEPC